MSGPGPSPYVIWYMHKFSDFDNRVHESSYSSRCTLTGGFLMTGQSLASPTFLSTSQAHGIHPKHLGRGEQVPSLWIISRPRGASLDGKVGSTPWRDMWPPCWWGTVGGMLKGKKGVEENEVRWGQSQISSFQSHCRMAPSQGNQKFIFLFCSFSFHPNSPRSSIQLYYGLNRHWGIGLAI